MASTVCSPSCGLGWGIHICIQVFIQSSRNSSGVHRSRCHEVTYCMKRSLHYFRCSPNCEELTAAASSLPGFMASMINTLPLMCNDPRVISWQQLAGNNKPQQQAPASHCHAVDAPAAATINACIADSESSCNSVADGTQSNPSDHAHNGGLLVVKGRGQMQQGKGSGARNARLEVLHATSGVSVVQVCADWALLMMRVTRPLVAMLACVQHTHAWSRCTSNT